jgi:hypothetical protein
VRKKSGISKHSCIFLFIYVKFHSDRTSNDGALGLFQRASPPNNNNKKISSNWGQVPGTTIHMKKFLNSDRLRDRSLIMGGGGG